MVGGKVRGADGRLRYHGQGRRGNPGRIRPAIVDLGHAIAALTAARDELEELLRTDDERLRERLESDACGRVGMGIRFATQAIAGRKPPKRKRPRNQGEFRFR